MSYIKPVGILTYGLLILAIASGLLGWKVRFHKIAAIAAICMATLHAILVLSVN